MGKVKGKQRQDKYYHLAKEQGYRSRAAFKLQQLDARFRFLPTARAVLDLCAAPGGWLQVAVARAPAAAFVVGVDLVPIRPVRGAHALTEDITTSRCRSAVRSLMDFNAIPAFDLVLHDGSPNVGGAWAQEATAQSALVIDAVRLATAFLAPGGAFVTKVFRSQDFNAILFCLRQLFGKVEVHKPAASRGSSAEIYIVCLKYKAPARIHPELLDIKHLFSVDSEHDMPIIDVLSTSNKSKKRPPRVGYEPGVTVLRNVGLASDFVWSDAQTPQEFLGSCTEISFDDPASLPIKDHELTTDEVRFLCEDLRVLDKNSYKHILRWRVRLRKSLSSSSSQVTLTPMADGTVADAKAKGDGQLLQDMEELVGAIDRKQTGQKKRQSRRRAKDKTRKATGVQIDDATEDDDAQLDKMLDEAYERYVTKKGGEIKQECKRAKRTNPDADADLSEGREDDGHGITDQGSHEDQDQETSGGAMARHARAKLLNSLELLSESETLS
ncbi:hypothetical protein QYE76_015770 [Lolium multiflorum]|uniref:Uncharacterized protein n=1 Tax=Lolium multiflorum TaxID=4521 RepID=A0AAD8U7L6_LOLMU|nr:hypothetical protein QYE76_015770 [Lolium multiflorum]